MGSALSRRSPRPRSPSIVRSASIEVVGSGRAWPGAATSVKPRVGSVRLRPRRVEPCPGHRASRCVVPCSVNSGRSRLISSASCVARSRCHVLVSVQSQLSSLEQDATTWELRLPSSLDIGRVVSASQLALQWPMGACIRVAVARRIRKALIAAAGEALGACHAHPALRRRWSACTPDLKRCVDRSSSCLALDRP